MNSRQRNIHKWTWILIAVLIPVTGFLALKSISVVSAERSAHFTTNEDRSFFWTDNMELAAKVESEESVLAIKLHKPLKSASTLVYSLDGNGNKGQLLGQLNGTGEYWFQLSERPDGIVLYDMLKEVEIEKLEFSWE